MSDIQSNSGSTDGPNGGHNGSEDKDMSPMIGLNEDVLIEIFSHLSLKERMSLRRVCNQWKGFIDSSFKSQNVLNLSSIGLKKYQSMSEKAICLLIRKCCYVKHISFKDMFVSSSRETSLAERKTTDNVVVNIVSNCESLESIDFGFLYGFEEEFERNANYFRRLQKISSKYMSEKALNLIIDSQNLKTIDIRGNEWIYELDFKRLGKGIKKLDLMDSFVDNEVTVKDICCGNGVNITNLSIDIKDKNVLTIICKHLKQLKTFELSLISKVIDFKPLSNLKHLKSLEIYFNHTIVENFMHLFRSLKNTDLIELRLNFGSFSDPMFDNKSFQELQQNCPLIETLVIIGAKRISGTGMQSVAQMRNIKHLDIRNRKNITDEIEVVITSCPLLRELILHNCRYISESVVKTFIQKSKTLPKEEFYLDVINTNVSEESVNALKPPKNLKIVSKLEECVYECCKSDFIISCLI